MTNAILQAVGWLGSALLVFSVLQSKFLRFRVLNSIASTVLVVYNAILAVWPMAAVNAALVVINVWFIVTLQRTKQADKAFAFVTADARWVDWFAGLYGDDLATFYPSFTPSRDAPGPPVTTVILFHADRAIGLVAWRPAAVGTATLLADYVIPPYRDYAPGGYVYSAAGPLRQAGFWSVQIDHATPTIDAYLRRLGFQATGPERLQLSLKTADAARSAATKEFR